MSFKIFGKGDAVDGREGVTRLTINKYRGSLRSLRIYSLIAHQTCRLGWASPYGWNLGPVSAFLGLMNDDFDLHFLRLFRFDAAAHLGHQVLVAHFAKC